MERLRFLHIPKTAGTTFASILRRQYPGKTFFFNAYINNKEKYESLSEADRENVALFSGHMPIETGIKDADDAAIITILRNPVARVKSFCQHVSEGKSEHLINVFPPESFSLDRFLQSGNPELSNLQTRMLTCHWNNIFSSWFENMSPLAARDAALDNLFHRISCFGLQEYYDESLIIFSSALNWKMPFYASKNRPKSGKLLNFEQHHIERIEELNAIDMEVYNIAKEWFIGMLDSAAFDETKLKRLRFINNTLGSAVLPAGETIVNVAKHANIESVKTSYAKQFWRKVRVNALAAGGNLIQKALRLFYSAQRPQTPRWAKIVIAATLVYFISPVDAIPDFIPVVGYFDDLGVIAAAAFIVSMFITDEVKQQASEKMPDWFGNKIHG